MFELIGRAKIGPGDLVNDGTGVGWLPIERVEPFSGSIRFTGAPTYSPSLIYSHPVAPTRAVPWYHTPAFVVVSLFLCWPVGVVSLWTSRRSVSLKLAVTVPYVFLVAVGCALLVMVASKMQHAFDSPSRAALTHAEPVLIAPEVPPVGQITLAVPIGRLLAEYKRNEVSADNEFKDRRVKTSGLVGSISKDILDNSFVTLGTGAQFEIPVVQCFLKSNRYVSALSPGDRITISGKVRGKIIMNVVLDDCEID